MDWKAAMSSEIFREYVKNELMREAQKDNIKEEPINTSQILNNFKKFEKKVNNDPNLKKAFKVLKAKLAEDPEYRAKVHPDFINGLKMLNIEDDDE